MELSKILKASGWHFTDEGLKTLTSAVGDDPDPRKIIDEALNRDLRDIGGGALPTKREDSAVTLAGRIVLQVLKVRNIAAPKANEESKAAPRLLQLDLSDGQSTLQGLELEPVPSLNLNIAPGTKIYFKAEQLQLIHGFLLLRPNDFQLLGGRVDALYEKWEFARTMLKYARSGRPPTGSAAPPPWVAFGKDIEDTTDENFKSLVTTDKDKPSKENEEFNTMRNEAIAVASKAAVKKVFGGGGQNILDHNIKKILEKGFSKEEAVTALQATRNNLERALFNLKRRKDMAEGYNETHVRGGRGDRPFRGEGKRGASLKEEADAAKPAANATLFDFLTTKLPPKDGTLSETVSESTTKPTPTVDKPIVKQYERDSKLSAANITESKSQSLGDRSRFENNVSSSFAANRGGHSGRYQRGGGGGGGGSRGRSVRDERPSRGGGNSYNNERGAGGSSFQERGGAGSGGGHDRGGAGSGGGHDRGGGHARSGGYERGGHARGGGYERGGGHERGGGNDRGGSGHGGGSLRKHDTNPHPRATEQNHGKNTNRNGHETPATSKPAAAVPETKQENVATKETANNRRSNERQTNRNVNARAENGTANNNNHINSNNSSNNNINNNNNPRRRQQGSAPSTGVGAVAVSTGKATNNTDDFNNRLNKVVAETTNLKLSAPKRERERERDRDREHRRGGRQNAGQSTVQQVETQATTLPIQKSTEKPQPAAQRQQKSQPENARQQSNPNYTQLPNGYTYDPSKIMGFQSKETNEFAMSLLKSQGLAVAPANHVPAQPPPPALKPFIKPTKTMQSAPPVPIAQVGPKPQPVELQPPPQDFGQVPGDAWMWNGGDLCMAKYWDDGRYYEAEITAVAEKTCVVFFLGYGNHEEVLKSDILPLTDAQNRPLTNMSQPQHPQHPQHSQHSQHPQSRFRGDRQAHQHQVYVPPHKRE